MSCYRARRAAYVQVCSRPFCFPLVERATRSSRNSVTAFVRFLMFWRSDSPIMDITCIALLCGSVCALCLWECT